ncbi:hypothetical protein [Aeoliella mucimassa]|uniref:Uncharacterized protein n=1 Tax=Aeoliella mucimassa TaxID=2527972 RepID=A0A518AHA5_9BACT|nr:hypothetical protein [Aeoliella mucimassa]QDU54074.1 hypothetical protein Pan181_02540 [Aeoliella mucimassa]
MFKSTLQFAIVSMLFASPAMAQLYVNKSYYPAEYRHHGHHGVIIVNQGPVYPGPVSQTDRWRFQQSIREYHEAIAAQNRAEVKRRELEIAQLQVQRNTLQESVVAHHAEQLLTRRLNRQQRIDHEARELWQQIRSSSPSWPVAFATPWAMERLHVIVDAAKSRDSYSTNSGTVEIAFDELRQAIRTQQLTEVRDERTDALKTLARLERILERVLKLPD